MHEHYEKLKKAVLEQPVKPEFSLIKQNLATDLHNAVLTYYKGQQDQAVSEMKNEVKDMLFFYFDIFMSKSCFTLSWLCPKRLLIHYEVGRYHSRQCLKMMKHISNEYLILESVLNEGNRDLRLFYIILISFPYIGNSEYIQFSNM